MLTDVQLLACVSCTMCQQALPKAYLPSFKLQLYALQSRAGRQRHYCLSVEACIGWPGRLRQLKENAQKACQSLSLALD